MFFECHTDLFGPCDNKAGLIRERKTVHEAPVEQSLDPLRQVRRGGHLSFQALGENAAASSFLDRGAAEFDPDAASGQLLGNIRQYRSIGGGHEAHQL